MCSIDGCDGQGTQRITESVSALIPEKEGMKLCHLLHSYIFLKILIIIAYLFFRRWSNAFSEEPPVESAKDIVNRKATIVIEYMIQAADVAHTMEHWTVYRKWNSKFFFECSDAYHNGRADRDPADYWYKGELSFFDCYVIPLAEKLHSCGVFGALGDDHLTTANRNRREWELRGQQIVAELVEKYQRTRYRRSSSVVIEEEEQFQQENEEVFHQEPI